MIISIMLFLKMLKDNFVSNSQLHQRTNSLYTVVSEDAKRQLCKQFTTVSRCNGCNVELFLKMLKDNFVSNSQPYSVTTR